MTTTDIYRKEGVLLSDRDERAQRAVKAFRALQPALSAYARVLTKRRDVRVEMSAHDNGSTDGTKIYFRPPIALGDKTQHERRLCDKRDDKLQLLCPACLVREDVLTTIYHEIAHICFESFAQTSEQDKVDALKAAVAEHGSKYSRNLELKMKLAPHQVKNSYIGLSSLISPFLPMLVNCLEDARVNAELFRARKGTKVMFDANTHRTFEEGVEQRTATGELVTIKWDQYPLNAQVMVGIFCRISGYDYRNWFVPEVVEALGDSELIGLMNKIFTIRTAKGTYELAFPILVRLRELGFCKSEEDPEPESEEKSDEPGTDSEDSSDSGSDASDESDVRPGDAPGEGEAGDGDSGADDKSEDASSGGGDSEEAGDSEVDSNEDLSGGSSDPSGADDSDDEATGDESSGGAESDVDSVPSGADSSSAGDPGGDSAGRSELESKVDDEPSGDSSRESAEAEQSDDHDSSASGEGADHDAQSDSREGSDDGESSDPLEGEGDSEPASPVNDELIDTGADEGEGGVTVHGEPVYGTPEDVELSLAKWGDHDDKPKDVELAAQEAADAAAIIVAIVQGMYFEMPSTKIVGVREHYFGKPIEVNGTNLSIAWDHGMYSASGHSRRALGIEGDFDVPESILGPALLRMRVAFSDNARGKDVYHLKSGKINGKVLGKRAPGGDERLFRKKIMPGKRDYFVLLGLDISGSTVGRNIQLIKAAALAQAELLARMGIKFAIYAHSGNIASSVLETAPGTSWAHRTGLDLDIYHVKDSDEPWDVKTKERLELLGPDSANLDGHSLEFYRKRCDERQETDKIILYYSDGKMPAENYDEELDILQREIRICRQKKYTLLGVGIRTDSPRAHGLDTVQVDDLSEVGLVVRHLEKVLR